MAGGLDLFEDLFSHFGLNWPGEDELVDEERESEVLFLGVAHDVEGEHHAIDRLDILGGDSPVFLEQV